MTSESKWKETLEEFRALGGTAENIRLGYGPLGRGLFPVDPAKPVAISIPESLLVPRNQVIFDHGVFRIRTDSQVSERGRAFIERYECDFAWGTEARVEVERALTIMHTLPEELRRILEVRYGFGRFLQPLTAELLQEAFLGSRSITPKKLSVVMPIIELVNHGGTVEYGGAICTNEDGSVSVQGEFEGEVLVQYSISSDPYDIFSNWFFVSHESCAFCMPLTYTKGGREYRIDREFDNEPWPWVPKVSVHGSTVLINYLLLGHQRFPRVPRAAFRKALANAGLEPQDELFDEIQHANRQNFLELIDKLEGIDTAAVPPIRTVARYQLNALSFYFGTRQL